MASTVLKVVVGHDILPTSKLAKSERELAEALIDQFEAFYRQGCILERIKDEREFADAGYESFDEYMNDRHPVGMNARYAWRIIAAKSIRHLLPDWPIGRSVWTEGSIRPLTSNKFTPSDVKRLGKKIATRVRNGDVLTAAMVKQVCDDDLGITRKKTEKQLDESDTPAAIIKNMMIDIKLWQKSLQDVPEGFWSDAESESRGCVKKLSRTCSEFASWLIDE